MAAPDKSLPDEMTSAVLASQLLQQLEKDQQQAGFIIANLTSQLENERQKNAADWERLIYGPESASRDFEAVVLPVRKNHEAAQSIRQSIRDEERRLQPTNEEKCLARGIALGTIAEDSLDSCWDLGKIQELAEYYFSELMFSKPGDMGGMLARQLEEQLQRSASLIARLTDQIEAEHQINDVEWEQFFLTACLKNTITGEPICTREDFWRWKQQYDEARAKQRSGQHSQEKRENFYLIESEDGHLVRVPESRLETWSKAQSKPQQPLSEPLGRLCRPQASNGPLARKRREQQVKSIILSKLYEPASNPPLLAPDVPNQSAEDYWDGLLEYVDGLPRPKAKKITGAPLPIPAPKDDTQKPSPAPSRAVSTAPTGPTCPPVPAKKRRVATPLVCLALAALVLLGIFWGRSTVSDPVIPPSGTGSVEQIPSVSDTRASEIGANYIGSVKSAVIHKMSCLHAQKIIPENRIYYDTLRDAIADGRKKCSVCFPAEAGN